MSKNSNSGSDRKERVIGIKKLIKSFCETHLDDELEGYAIKLYEELGRKRKIDIRRGKKEIWAASIIYVISRLNFLFDRSHERFITPDTICDFFGTVKSTTGNKATQIQKECKLAIGAEGYCSPKISDLLTFHQTPDGFIIPKSSITEKEIIVEFVDGEAAAEIERFVEEQRLMREQKEKEKRERRTELNRKIAEQKRAKNHNKNQLDLLGDLL